MPKGYEHDAKKMSFLDHLGELRQVLIHSIIVLLVGAALAWAFSGRVLDLLIIHLDLESVQMLKPMEAFNARFQVALFIGLVVGLPLIALRTWVFIAPGLRINERKIIVPSSILTSLLFMLGLAFAILFLIPSMLKFLLSFGTEHAQPNLTLSGTLSFVFRMALACGILFQLPLVIGLTSLIGLTNPRMLLGKWRHAVVAIFILAAIATPGDGPSQIVLAAPLVILYFVSVLLSWVIWRSRGKKVSEARATDPATAAGGSGESEEPDESDEPH